MCASNKIFTHVRIYGSRANVSRYDIIISSGYDFCKTIFEKGVTEPELHVKYLPTLLFSKNDMFLRRAVRFSDKW